MQHPLPLDVGIFASRAQSAAMRRAGLRLLFEPRMRVTHAYHPRFEAELRPAMGYGVIQVRRDDPRLPYASLARLGYLSIPIFVVGRTLVGWIQACASIASTVSAGMSCRQSSPSQRSAACRRFRECCGP